MGKVITPPSPPSARRPRLRRASLPQCSRSKNEAACDSRYFDPETAPGPQPNVRAVKLRLDAGDQVCGRALAYQTVAAHCHRSPIGRLQQGHARRVTPLAEPVTEGVWQVRPRPQVAACRRTAGQWWLRR
ncbi:hypothetical protein MRX96_004192 [Rhipicephalus microplus]